MDPEGFNRDFVGAYSPVVCDALDPLNHVVRYLHVQVGDSRQSLETEWTGNSLCPALSEAQSYVRCWTLDRSALREI